MVVSEGQGVAFVVGRGGSFMMFIWTEKNKKRLCVCVCVVVVVVVVVRTLSEYKSAATSKETIEYGSLSINPTKDKEER